jgi:CDP-6-deoxy-D-xylo-4-hexulose-3-dehydrase
MLPLAASTWGDEERQAAIDVINSGQYTMGERTARFEKAFARYIGTKYAIACNSGSSANLLMVAAYGLRYGKGTVIVPAVAWATSYSPFQQYGWHCVFVDVDRETLNYKPLDLWKALEKHEDPVILAVNLLGNPNDFNAFPRKVHVLEDNCESLGAEYECFKRGWKKTGSFGLMASHSTFFSHHICTMEGGVVTTDDEWLYQAMLCIRSHGWTRHLPEKNVFGVKPSKFDFIMPGYNVRPTEIQCAIGLKQLEKIDKIIEGRRDNAQRFPLKTQKETGRSSWFGFTVFGEDVERVSKVAETRPVVTGNFLRSPSIRYYRHEVFGETPNADYIHDHACFIGNNHNKIDWSQLCPP